MKLQQQFSWTRLTTNWGWYNTLKDRILFCGIWGHDPQIGVSFRLQCCPLVSAGVPRQCCPGLLASWLLRLNPGTSEGGLRQWSPEPDFQLLEKPIFKNLIFQSLKNLPFGLCNEENSACYWTCIWSFLCIRWKQNFFLSCFCNSKSW